MRRRLHKELARILTTLSRHAGNNTIDLVLGEKIVVRGFYTGSLFLVRGLFPSREGSQYQHRASKSVQFALTRARLGPKIRWLRTGNFMTFTASDPFSGTSTQSTVVLESSSSIKLPSAATSRSKTKAEPNQSPERSLPLLPSNSHLPISLKTISTAVFTSGFTAFPL